MKFLEWLKNENKTTNKDNIFVPALEPQMALDFLCDYLLGEDWYEERNNRSGRRSNFAARFISCSKRK